MDSRAGLVTTLYGNGKPDCIKDWTAPLPVWSESRQQQEEEGFQKLM